jgi:hypothetical protein
VEQYGQLILTLGQFGSRLWSLSGFEEERNTHPEIPQWNVSILGLLALKTLLTLHISFDRLADAPVDENGQVAKRYDIIQADGLPGVGERVDPQDVYVNKQSPTNATDNTFTGQAASVPYKNSPLSYKSPVSGMIDKVLISDTDNDQTLIKVLIRQTRRPELGDKFSSRHGQKGVCGLIVNQEDMPFNDDGINPGKSALCTPDQRESKADCSNRYNYESSRFPLSYDRREDD